MTTTHHVVQSAASMTQATAQTTAVALQDPVQEEITTMMTTIVLHLAAEMMGTVLAASVVHALKITTLIIARIVHRDVVIRDGIRGKTGIGITMIGGVIHGMMTMIGEIRGTRGSLLAAGRRRLRLLLWRMRCRRSKRRERSGRRSSYKAIWRKRAAGSDLSRSSF